LEYAVGHRISQYAATTAAEAPGAAIDFVEVRRVLDESQMAPE
jgi:hypothetical protein